MGSVSLIRDPFRVMAQGWGSPRSASPPASSRPASACPARAWEDGVGAGVIDGVAEGRGDGDASAISPASRSGDCREAPMTTAVDTRTTIVTTPTRRAAALLPPGNRETRRCIDGWPVGIPAGETLEPGVLLRVRLTSWLEPRRPRLDPPPRSARSRTARRPPRPAASRVPSAPPERAAEHHGKDQEPGHEDRPAEQSIRQRRASHEQRHADAE